MPQTPAPFFAAHQADLDALTSESRRRRLIPQAGADFSSNDYLGLSNSPDLRAAVAQALGEGVPVGSGGSRLLRGNHAEHEALEIAAAEHYRSEAALYFPTGFIANAAFFATVPQRGDLILYDHYIHASVHDGMRQSRAECRPARHNDVADFEAQITAYRATSGTGTIWIAVESLYSMDGDFAPLDDLAALADRHDAILVIDEAHGTGVYGPNGIGLAHKLAGRPNLITLHTCGKALGCEGALLCAPKIICDFIVNRGRPFIFSTAPSPLMARAVRAALDLVTAQPERQTRLAAQVAHAKSRLTALGFETSPSQIIPIIIGDNARTMALASSLQEAGFDVRGIRPPTVPHGTARLRLAITLNVDEKQIDAVINHLAAEMERL